MKFASGISDAVQITEAAEQVCQQVETGLAGRPCQLVYVFASPLYRARWDEVLARIHARLKPGILLGCSGAGVIGGDKELERVPALSVLAAHLPQVKLVPFVVQASELTWSSAGGFWVEKIGVLPEERPVFVLLADPEIGDPSKLLAELNATFPGCPIIGGLVSSGETAGEHLLFHDSDTVSSAAVGLAMSGDIAMDTLIASGCRPIGRPLVVTRAEDNIIWEVGGRQTLEALRQVLAGLPPADQERAQHALSVGLVINEMKPSFRPGDFLIRDLVGIDPPSGAIALGEPVRVGQTVQFHLRDPGASRDELRRLLAERSDALQAAPPAGGLLFNCLGRGRSFYGTPHHDMRTIRTFSGRLPIGGFFCNGEIGPVGGTNFLHGYTASLGLFRPSTPLRTEP